MSDRCRTLIPIRSFAGMTRLENSLGSDERRLLAENLAGRVALAATAADTRVVVITNDAAVRRWARTLEVEWIAEPVPGSLNDAAAAGVAAAGGDPWLVVHADLPAIGPDDIRVASSMAAAGMVLAPSHDGGTSLVGGRLNPFPFQYGPGSFRRHLSAVLGRATILVRPGLALDLDRPRDLRALRRLAYLVDDTSRAFGLNGRAGR